MNFTVKENTAKGTAVGTLPTGSSIRLLSGDKNNNGTPGLALDADNVIRVNDASELDFERLINIEPNYYFLLTRSGADEVVTVTVTNEENETLLGTPGDDVLRSGFGATLIIGLEGNDQMQADFSDDILVSGPGADALTGGGGDDRFVFDAPIRSGIDTITDFINNSREKDLIVLDRDIFTRLRRKELSFEEVRSRKAAKASSALFVYNSRSGALFYNQNQSKGGFGRAGGRFALLGKDLELSAATFLVQD